MAGRKHSDKDSDKRAPSGGTPSGATPSGATPSGETAASTPPEPPRFAGMRPLGAVLPKVTRAAYKRRSPATASLMTDWEAVVGPAIAAVTVPRKLFAGTLVIVCPGPVAMELQHLAASVISRINTHLGRVAVTRLRFVQDITPARPVPKPPPRRAIAAAERAVAELPPGDLRDALERLGRVVLALR